MKGRVRLDRALSKLGVASRNEARLLILAGRVTVDGCVASDPAHLVVPERGTIALDGHTHRRQPPRMIALHKPRGVVTTRRDPDGRPTVFDVLGDAAAGLQAIGRLDQASTGLLLFTNDTRLAHHLTDPASAIPRRYIVTVRGRVLPADAARLETGLVVPAARATPAERLAVTSVTIRKASSRETHLVVELTEGRNRELRRMFGVLGHEVTRIHRVAFGPYELGNLQPGQWRECHVARPPARSDGVEAIRATRGRADAASVRRRATRDT